MDLGQKRAGQGEQTRSSDSGWKGNYGSWNGGCSRTRGRSKNLQQIRDNYQSYQNGVRSLLQPDQGVLLRGMAGAGSPAGRGTGDRTRVRGRRGSGPGRNPAGRDRSGSGAGPPGNPAAPRLPGRKGHVSAVASTPADAPGPAAPPKGRDHGFEPLLAKVVVKPELRCLGGASAGRVSAGSRPGNGVEGLGKPGRERTPWLPRKGTSSAVWG